jgi:voltage-dependent potassium channel beta subunit
MRALVRVELKERTMAEMRYRRLGKSGLKVSELSFGSWVTFHKQIDLAASMALMRQAFESGVNFFDNAEAYASGESERLMGEALRQLGWPRGSYIVSTKVYWGGKLPTQKGLSRKHIRDACDNGLRRLQVDYLDLYFCHRPDHETPLEETVRAMGELVQQGKVLYWGTSEWEADQIAEAHGIARELRLAPPTMEQPQYNLFERAKVERDYARLYDSIGLGTTIWSPLASGILTGKYEGGVPEGSRMSLAGMEWLRAELEGAEGRRRVAMTRELAVLAAGLGASVAQLAIAWCLLNPRVGTVILGATSAGQLAENLGAMDVVPKLTPEVVERIEAIVRSKPAPRPTY